MHAASLSCVIKGLLKNVGLWPLYDWLKASNVVQEKTGMTSGMLRGKNQSRQLDDMFNI